MEPAVLIQELGVYGGAFLICMISGVFPVVNAELSVVGLVALAPDYNFPLIVLMATLGETTAKMAMYWGARGTCDLSLRRYEHIVARWRSRFSGAEPGRSMALFVSALVGIPPFFVTAIVAGAMRVPFARLWVVGFAGRLLRFGLIGLFPKVLIEYL